MTHINTSEVEPVEHRKVRHCFDDLHHAGDSLIVETPRATVPAHEFECVDLEIAITRHETGCGITPYGPHIILTLEWCVDDDTQHPLSDLWDSYGGEIPTVLWGNIHLWQMELPRHEMVSQEVDGGNVYAEAELRWYGVETIGWR